MTSRPDRASDETNGRWHAYLQLLFPAVTSLRERLGIDEAVFRSSTFRVGPRAFVLWSALDEVGKTAMFLIKLDGHLGNGPFEPESAIPDWIDRVSSAIILEEERLRTRRLCEALTQLVLFAQKDEAAYYTHLLLLEEIHAASWYNEDLGAFHGARSAWVQVGIDRAADEIAAVEAGIDFAHAWYANYRSPLDTSKRNYLTSMRRRIQVALPRMTTVERLAMGTTYDEAFGQPSATIHYRAGSYVEPRRGSEAEILGEGSKLVVVAFCVINRCFELLGRPASPAAEQISRALANDAEAHSLLNFLTDRSRIEEGDFVAARGYLGQILRATSSPLGYRSFEVEFMAERPVPALAVDWFRARDVQLLFRRADLLTNAALLGSVNPDRAAHADIRGEVRDVWERSLREEVRSRMGARPPAPAGDETV